MRNEPWVWPEVGGAGASGAGAVPLRSAQMMGQQKKKKRFQQCCDREPRTSVSKLSKQAFILQMLVAGFVFVMSNSRFGSTAFYAASFGRSAVLHVPVCVSVCV